MPLTLAVQNLVDNAMKDSPGSPPSLCRWTRRGKARISVEDKGVGLSSERATGSPPGVRPRQRGTSAECERHRYRPRHRRQVAKAHGGRLDVESEWVVAAGSRSRSRSAGTPS